jgi:hypothetical protein
MFNIRKVKRLKSTNDRLLGAIKRYRDQHEDLRVEIEVQKVLVSTHRDRIDELRQELYDVRRFNEKRIWIVQGDVDHKIYGIFSSPKEAFKFTSIPILDGKKTIRENTRYQTIPFDVVHNSLEDEKNQ